MKLTTLLSLLATTAAVVISGCASQPYTVFAPTGTVPAKPGSIAVVAGLGDQLSVDLAQQVTSDLQADSRFTVITQHEITNKFSAYPANIIDDPTNFALDDVQKFDRIQRGLGVDNILTVWVYNYEAQSGSVMLGSGLRFTIGGRLLTYPGGQIAGTTDFYYDMGSLGKTEKEALHEMVVNASQILVTKFLKETETGKANDYLS